MKKYSIIYFTIISAMFALFACCANKNSDYTSSELNAPEPNNTEVILTIKEPTIGVDTEEITFIIENNSDKIYGYEQSLYLEKEINGKWTIIPTLDNVVFEADMFCLLPSGKGELPFQINAFYGNLSADKYRIIKEIYLLDNSLRVIDTGYYIDAEFEIE